MRAERPAVLKIAVSASRLSGCLRRDAVAGGSDHVDPMGDGLLTRVWPAWLGSLWMRRAAPGQLSTRELVDVYRIRRTTNVRVLAHRRALGHSVAGDAQRGVRVARARKRSASVRHRATSPSLTSAAERTLSSSRPRRSCSARSASLSLINFAVVSCNVAARADKESRSRTSDRPDSVVSSSRWRGETCRCEANGRWCSEPGRSTSRRSA
jgi:hypothetical protein